MDKKKLIRYLLTDLAAALVCIGAFLLYFYVLPQKQAGEGTVLLAEEAMDAAEFSLPEPDAHKSTIPGSKPGRDSSESSRPANSGRQDDGSGKPAGSGSGSGSGRGTAESRGSGGSTGTAGARRPGGGMGSGNTNTTEIGSDTQAAEELAQTDRSTEILEEYQDSSKQLTITKTVLGEGSDTITYYTADIYLTSVSQLKTAFADDTFGKNIRSTTLEMAEQQNALLAVSGDSYGNSDTGVVVRNGVLYRSDTNDAEICVLFADGTMDIYTPEAFDREEILQEDVWQIWNFGPSLLENGEVRDSFQTTAYLNRTNPRCAVGYVAPGHYKLVLVDGRQSGYSRGATMSELAQIMKDEGCSLAYNLDGGKSAAMVYDGAYVNEPADGGREISDIIWIGKE